MSLPDRFKIVRESLGLSQKDMAKALDISLPSLQGYEAARSVPGGNVFEALVKMGFNANWLLTGEGEMKHESDTYPLSEGFKNGDLSSELDKGQPISQAKPDLKWFHDWVDEELHGKTMSEIMAIAVKIKTVLDEHK